MPAQTRRTLRALSLTLFGWSALTGCQDQLSTPSVDLAADSLTTVFASRGASEPPVVVMSASPSAPGQVASGPVLWLRADSGVTASPSGVVQRWLDLSSEGRAADRAASQAAMTARPTLVKNGMSGYPVVRFNGTSEFLSVGEGFADFSAGATVFLVMKPSGLPSAPARLLDFAPATGTDGALTIARLGDTFRLEPSSASAAPASAFQVVGGARRDSTQILALSVSATGAARFAKNGADVRDSAAAGAVASVLRTRNVLGARFDGRQNFFAGDLAEVLVYARTLTVVESEAISRYLGVKYGIALPPTLAFTGDTVYTDAPQTLTALASTPNAGDSVSVTWSFSDGLAPATGLTVVRTFTTLGPITATITTTNTYGMTRTLVRTLTVLQGNRPPVLAFTPPTDLITGVASTFAAAVTDPDVGDTAVVVWSFGDSTASQTGASVSKTYAVAGTYAITITATDTKGAVTTFTQAVTVAQGNRAPVVAFTPPSPILAGGAATYTATATDPDMDPVTVSWTFGDGTAATVGASVSHAYAAPGPYTITITATDSLGASTTVTQVVTVVLSAGPAGVGGASLWLRADTLVQSTGGVVTQWTDLSGHHMHGTNATPSMRPTLVAGAMNGRPVVRWDGVSQFLDLPAGFADFTQGMTMFAVARATKAVEFDRVFDLGSPSLLNRILVSRSGTTEIGTLILQGNAVGALVTSSGGRFPVNETRLLGTTMGTGASPTHSLYVNGNLEASAASLSIPNVLRTVNGIGKTMGGDGAVYGGDFAELVIYPYLLSPAQRIAVETHLRTYWAASAAPTLTPVWPSNVTSGQAATFSATTTDPDGDAVSLAWVFGDGTTGTGLSVAKTYAVAGTYTVTVTATDSYGVATVSSQVITVVHTPRQLVADLAFSPGSPVTPGTVVTLNACASSSPAGGRPITTVTFVVNGVTVETGLWVNGCTTTYTVAAAAAQRWDEISVTVANGSDTPGTSTQFLSVTPPAAPAGVGGVSLWLRADVGVETTSGQVTRWSDQSGQVLDLTEGTAASRPTLVTNSLNALPVVRFSAVSLQKLCTSGFDARLAGTAYTTFTVVRAAPGADYQTLLGARSFAPGSGAGRGYNHYLIPAAMGGFWQFWFGNGVQAGYTSVNSGVAGSAATAAVITARHTGSIATVSVNGVVMNTTTSGSGASTQGPFCVGMLPQVETDGTISYQYPLNGDIAEVIFYPRAVSDAERSSIEAMLKARWATP